MRALRNDLTGQKFGRLTVLGRADVPHRKVVYTVQCDCGNVKDVFGNSLSMGLTKSCGCLQRDIASQTFSKAPGEAGFTNVYGTYKRHALDRGLEFAIAKEDFRALTQQSCHYCGDVPKNISKPTNATTEFVYNGVDRVDNSKGYVAGNVVTACKICNAAKSSLTEGEFNEWIQRLITHQTKQV